MGTPKKEDQELEISEIRSGEERVVVYAGSSGGYHIKKQEYQRRNGPTADDKRFARESPAAVSASPQPSRKQSMSTIEWSEKFEVGNFEIDAEHKIFVKIIQKIIQAQQNNAKKHFTESLLMELLKYAEFHFCSEENIMIENDYPALLKHKKEHERVLAELRNRIFSLKHEFIDFENLETFLTEWFKHHTTTEDRKLAVHITNKNA